MTQPSKPVAGQSARKDAPDTRERADIPIPSFYDDLDGTLAEAWRMLSRGVADRRSPFHTPAVATTGLDGAPRVRTVVLRGVDVASRTIRFHSDARSGKFAEISKEPRVAVIGYDAGHKIQLRLTGRAQLHHGAKDTVATQAWAATGDRSRSGYRQSVGPGAAMATGQLLGPPLVDGFENFVAVRVAIDAIEWLYLAHAGHRRAHFTWTGETLNARWLAP